ncbi:hypothetical protein LCGC14_0330230 [marine sediment metagenome]|uniref:Uncharacterized protein n=1 Tax=marine sediment metagenome TaxID=412755 RepID=A0A0F9TGS4_9ZZZZ
MTNTLLRCHTCGVPGIECLRTLTPYASFLTDGQYGNLYQCYDCQKESSIFCSHCSEPFPNNKPLPEPLDDGSFLCVTCDHKLLEELDDFTSNN